MLQRFTKTEVAANGSSVMRTGNHSQNGASPKSLRSRGKFLMFGMLLLVFCGFTNKAAAQFAGGSGTATDPYLISTPEHLVQLVYYLGV